MATNRRGNVQTCDLNFTGPLGGSVEDNLLGGFEVGCVSPRVDIEQSPKTFLQHRHMTQIQCVCSEDRERENNIQELIDDVNQFESSTYQ